MEGSSMVSLVGKYTMSRITIGNAENMLISGKPELGLDPQLKL
jgi:hypothetical protein